MWMHRKYGMRLIARKLYSEESNNCSYLTVQNDTGTNQMKQQKLWLTMHKRKNNNEDNNNNETYEHAL